MHLSFNRIGDAGCAALAEALKVTNAVTYLVLSNNSIGDVGCAALAEALKVNAAVSEVHCMATALAMAVQHVQH